MRPLIFALLLAGSPLTERAVVAAYLPQSPASSLDALLRDIWAQGPDKAYDLYMGKSEVPMSAAAREAFPQKMIDLAADAGIDGIVLQKAKGEYYPKSHLPGPRAFDEAYFVHFLRPGFQGDKITERIYINVHPDHAADVIGFAARELLKPDHGVMEVKVATPPGLVNRADAIVIYTSSLADVDWALGLLAQYQEGHRDHFLKDLPAATRPRLMGVSTAAQPEASLKAESFGTYLANTAAAALSQKPPPADFAEFRSRVRARMTADGVDPDHPDRLTRGP
jgi:hypothetical protein